MEKRALPKLTTFNTIIVLIIFIDIYLGDFFFSICSIFGLDFYSEESEKVPYFMYAYMLFDVIVLFAYFKSMARYGLNKIDYLSFLIIGIIFLLYMIDSPTWHEGITIYKSFIAKCIPAMLGASVLSKTCRIEDFIKNFDILIFVTSIGLIINLPRYLVGMIGIGGASYQALAYISALAFSLNIYMILSNNDESRYPIFRKKWYRLISYIFLAVQVVTCIMSGGRGGAVLIVCSTLLTFWVFLRHKMSNLLTKVVLFLGLAYAVSYTLPAQYGEIIQKGFERSFSYLSSDGINMSQTSNRDILYEASWNAIIKQPILGYGLFKYIDVNKFYPHNFFLEVLMQGGFVYLVVMLIALNIVYRRYHRLIYHEKSMNVLGIIALYPMIYLLFSGSYVAVPLFWFSVFYILQLNKRSF